MKELKIVCVHGLGDEGSVFWKDKWEDCIRLALPLPKKETVKDAERMAHFSFIQYDDLFFDKVRLETHAWLEAAAKLLWGWNHLPTLRILLCQIRER